MSLNLKVITPLEVFNIGEVDSIQAEGSEGYFTILPKHADYVSSLKISIFSFKKKDDTTFFAIDGGILAKVGDEVKLSIKNAIKGNNLQDLKNQMTNEFTQIDDNERKTRAALASLEGNIAKLMQELND